MDIQKMIQELQIEKRAFINGKYLPALDGDTIQKNSTATGQDLSGLSSCKAADVDRAVAAARAAFQSGCWADLDPAEKKQILFRLADLMEEHLEELALLDCIETGRALKNYLEDSIPKSIEAVRFFTEAVDKVYDQAITPRKTAFATVTREPLGVVGLITPWNDPLVVAAWKFAPALLMGNAVVVKPAEQSSFSMIRLAALAKEAGIPDGVFNVVPGYGETAGKALALHPDVDGIFFTGSSQTGKLIMQYAGQSNMKKVGLECGGKSAFVVSDKCRDLKTAAETLAQNVFYNQGQICSAPSRLLINRKVKDEFMGYLLPAAVKYIPGNPLDLKNIVGCVVNSEQKARIDRYIQIALSEGAVKCDLPADVAGVEGMVCSVPVVLDKVTPESTIAREEVFGPVLSVIETETLSQAIDIANSSEFGLAAAIWTSDLDEAYYAARKLQAGIVHINSYGEDDNTVPFGGFKQSGIGKDKSIHAFYEYSELKTTWMKFNGAV